MRIMIDLVQPDVIQGSKTFCKPVFKVIGSFFLRSTGSSFTVDDIGTDAYRKAYTDISPETYIKNEGVSAVLAYGTRDKLIPISMPLKFSGALKKTGTDCTIIEYTKSGHTMALDSDKNKEYYETVDRYLEQLVVK